MSGWRRSSLDGGWQVQRHRPPFPGGGKRQAAHVTG
jgi:hypothetical protein